MAEDIKKNPKRKRERLRQIEVLLADPDPRISRLVRHVLENFGFKHIHSVKSGAEAIELLRQKPIDLVITEWPMEPTDGINFVKFVRNSKDIANRDVPIIMLTGRAETYDVESARDSGVTEFVVKPFNAKTLSHRIIQVIDNPRAFIVAPNFIGPDRRRREDDDAAASQNRRTDPEEIKKTSRRKGNKLIYEVNGQEITVINPDRSLKQMLGADLTAEELFDDEIVKQAQELILSMKDEFVGWVSIDINRLEHCYTELEKDGKDRKALAEMTGLALTIKSQAGTFGYDFATAVGKSLYDFVASSTHMDAGGLMVLRKHIDTLYVIFQREIHGTGPEIGEEVLNGLRKLVEKYSKAA